MALTNKNTDTKNERQGVLQTMALTEKNNNRQKEKRTTTPTDKESYEKWPFKKRLGIEQ